MKHRKPRVPRRFRRMRLARLAEAHDLVMWAALGLVALAFILHFFGIV